MLICWIFMSLPMRNKTKKSSTFWYFWYIIPVIDEYEIFSGETVLILIVVWKYMFQHLKMAFRYLDFSQLSTNTHEITVDSQIFIFTRRTISQMMSNVECLGIINLNINLRCKMTTNMFCRSAKTKKKHKLTRGKFWFACVFSFCLSSLW